MFLATNIIVPHVLKPNHEKNIFLITSSLIALLTSSRLTTAQVWRDSSELLSHFKKGDKVLPIQEKSCGKKSLMSSSLPTERRPCFCRQNKRKFLEVERRTKNMEDVLLWAGLVSQRRCRCHQRRTWGVRGQVNPSRSLFLSLKPVWGVCCVV